MKKKRLPSCCNPDCRTPFEPRDRRQRSCLRDACKAWVKATSMQKTSIAIDRSKYMTEDELRAFLEAAKAQAPIWWLAFRVMTNAMLRVGELRLVRPVDVEILGDVATVRVVTLKRALRNAVAVRVDLETARAVLDFAKVNRIDPDKPLWPWSTRWTEKVFRMVLKAAKIRATLTPHALRHTGIMIRAKHVSTPEELEWLRLSARHASLQTTMLYVHTSKETEDKLVGKVKWA